MIYSKIYKAGKAELYLFRLNGEIMKINYNKFISPLYTLNIIFQALISLVAPIIIMLTAAWLLVKYEVCGNWIYVVLILLGVIQGFRSMIVFIINASRALDALQEQKSKQKEDKQIKNESR